MGVLRAGLFFYFDIDMSLKREIRKLMGLGEAEQEEAWGECVTVDGQECRGVFAPLEGWYEVELGGRNKKVQTSLRVRREALKGVPLAAGRKVVARQRGKVFRIARVRDWLGDVSLVLELAEE